jgi:hypothetical protein
VKVPGKFNLAIGSETDCDVVIGVTLEYLKPVFYDHSILKLLIYGTVSGGKV